MDVFHGFARTEEKDSFSRKRVHGLNKNYVDLIGFVSEAALLAAFKSWLFPKQCIALYANGAKREEEMLGLHVTEFQLAPWVERKNRISHQIALRYKELFIPVCGIDCLPVAHSAFESPPASSNSEIVAAKTLHGFHCALYDCLELYFEAIMSGFFHSRIFPK